MTMIIDVNSQYAPTTLLAELRRLGAFDELPAYARLMKAGNYPAYGKVVGPFARPPVGAGPGNPAGAVDPGRERELLVALEAERVQDLDAAGIDVQVVHPGAQQPYLRDPGRTREAAAAFNRAFAELIERHPRRFAAFACLPLPSVADAVAELDRCSALPGFVGVSVGCAPAGTPLDDPVFEPLWAELDRRGTPVHIHPGSTRAVLPGIDDYLMTGVYGGSLETAVAASRLVMNGVTTRYPNVPIILLGLGGLLPTHCHTFAEAVKPEYPGEYAAIGDFVAALGRLYYDTTTVEEPTALQAARETFGATQLLFGSHGPYTPPGKAVAYIRQSPCLTEAEKADVLGGNAARLFGWRDESDQVRCHVAAVGSDLGGSQGDGARR